ncbi:RNA polymerase sigma factor SigW [Metabacillus sp. RGM 3146]|uniref:RNA polymerase sigma factor SigW n=1 Tax=Metabacillus sp. RGM 3146 TaxID=3401092 RepID=UPI003B9BE545
METLVKARILQVKKGDKNAFAEIVNLYKDRIFQLCFRMLGNVHEAEDMAQEAFIKAYINLHTFKMEKKFSTWLYRIATNLSIDRLRKNKPDYYLDQEIAGTEGLTMYSQVAADVALPEEEVESMELQRTIHRGILELPEKYRSVVILKYLDELSLNEISEILNIPVGTVKTRIHRGREALRKRLRRL